MCLNLLRRFQRGVVTRFGVAFAVLADSGSRSHGARLHGSSANPGSLSALLGSLQGALGIRGSENPQTNREPWNTHVPTPSKRWFRLGPIVKLLSAAVGNPCSARVCGPVPSLCVSTFAQEPPASPPHVIARGAPPNENGWIVRPPLLEATRSTRIVDFADLLFLMHMEDVCESCCWGAAQSQTHVLGSSRPQSTVDASAL